MEDRCFSIGLTGDGGLQDGLPGMGSGRRNAMLMACCRLTQRSKVFS